MGKVGQKAFHPRINCYIHISALCLLPSALPEGLVTEMNLMLTLSLRFIPLVLEEIQNLIRSVMTRAINWKKLGFKGAAKVWLIVAERLLENPLLRAEQMVNAMVVRGFTSPNEHRVQWHTLELTRFDKVAIALLFLFWGVRLAIGGI